MPAAVIGASGSRRHAALHLGDGAVADVEVVHRGVDAGELAAGDRHLAFFARSHREDHGVVLVGELASVDIDADFDVVAELDPLGLEHRHPAVDDRLRQLGVGHPVTAHAAGRLVALIDDDVIAGAAKLLGAGEPGRPRADDRDRLAGRLGERRGLDPALGEAALDDRQLDLLDRHRVVVDVEHAGGLARRRADATGQLGKVVGPVKLVERLSPAALIDEVVPLRDQVAERAAVVAERDAAVHAARTLVLQDLVGLDELDRPVVAAALFRIALAEVDTAVLEESPRITHRDQPPPPAPRRPAG